MELNVGSDQVHERDFGNDPWSDGAGMLSPMSHGTIDSERRSLASPSQRFVRRGLSDPEDRTKSRASLRSSVSRANYSDGGASTTASDKGDHLHLPQAPVAVSEFREFIQACQNLEKYLESFTHQVQKLGSAFGLVKASRDMHDNLSTVRSFFEENAQTLGLLLKKIKATKSPKQAKKRKKRHGNILPRSDASAASSISENSQGNFIAALNRLARSVKRFTTAVMDFEDYSDDAGLKALQSFETELRVLSGGLEFFSADGESHELRRFVTARATSLKVHLDNLAEALKRFEEIGIPCISFAQKRSSRMLLNAATVATFFAGVAATTLQYSVEFTRRKREVAMNTLWFVSLVLSIGAAITGMLAMTWRLAVFSSPKRELPWYIRFWIRSGYLVLLIASVVAFLAGLVVFVFDQMPRVAFWIVTACTVFCVLGLSIVSGLFLKERYSFTQVRDELRKDLNPANWTRFYERDEGWWYWLRFHLIDQLREKRRVLVEHYAVDSKTADPDKFTLGLIVKDALRQCLPCFRNKPRRATTADSEAAMEGAFGEYKRPEPWKKSSKKPLSATRRGMRDHAGKERHDGTLDFWYKHQIRNLGLTLSAPMSTRVVHLQFSPHGHWLVVCYKYECCVFNVEDSFDYHDSLRHVRYNAKQVEWSPSGTRLITRTSISVKLWSVDNGRDFALQETFNFGPLFQKVTDIQWLNDFEFLAIVDQWQFFRVNVSESPPVITKYDPEPENFLLEIYYLYTLPDSELVMIVGARNIENVEEDKAIDCILVYEMRPGEPEVSSRSSHSSLDTRPSWNYTEGRGAIVRRIPLLNELESLCFGQYLDVEEKRRMVISYSDKAPEIWKVTLDDTRVHLSLERELVKKLEPGEEQDEEAEWGEVYLIGPSQNIAACAEDGMMYFWDTTDPSDEQFHRLKIIADDEEVEELPLVTWVGFQADNILPTLATAGKGFSLKIWAPLGSTLLDENQQIHGPMDDGLAQELHTNLNAPHIITPSDSGIGGKDSAMRSHPRTMLALPSSAPKPTRSDEGSHGAIPYESSPERMDVLNLHDDPSLLPDGSSHLAAGSQYCSSPESSLKDIENDAKGGATNKIE